MSGGHGHGHGHGHGRQRLDDAEPASACVVHDADPARHRADLEAGAGRGKLLFLDAFAGIAGDMTIAALVDLGVPLSIVSGVVTALGLHDVEVHASRAMAGAIGATGFHVHEPAAGAERSFADIRGLISGSSLDPAVQSLALAIFTRLAEAEARVHRVAVEQVHFHEVGAIDAIVDIVGAAACFVHLGAEVVASPLPLGRGSVECRHGVLPLPAPATVECLRGVPTYDAGIESELVTPTGAAIVSTVALRFERWPEFAPERIGWGAGTRKLPDRANALRVVLGGVTPRGSEADGHVVLECNVDDMTGELAAHALQALLTAGARDAWATPITMKKGRPGLTLSALAPRGAEARLAEVLLRETSSIGVRWREAMRIERPRRMIEVTTRFGKVPVKISEGPYGPPQVKPEFDVCARLASEAQVPVREVIAAALRAFHERL